MKRSLEPLIVVVLVALSAFAQTPTTGQLAGTVSDTSGAVLPKTQILVTSKETGLTRTTETNSTGYYLVPLLQPGHYTVSVTVQGFQAVVRDGITIEIGHALLVDFRLSAGGVNEKITVTADATLIEPGNPNTTTSFSATQLANIPNPGNDLSYIANLAPGAIMNTNSTSGGAQGNVEFNGLGSVANDFTVDGLDASQPYTNYTATGASGLQL